jgi:hypothetical protein
MYNSISGRGNIFVSPLTSGPGLGPTKPPIECVPWAIPAVIKRPEREV